MYQVTSIIQDAIDEDEQAENSLHVGSLMEVVDESGVGIVGRIVSVRIRSDRQD